MNSQINCVNDLFGTKKEQTFSTFYSIVYLILLKQFHNLSLFQNFDSDIILRLNVNILLTELGVTNDSTYFCS